MHKIKKKKQARSQKKEESIRNGNTAGSGLLKNDGKTRQEFRDNGTKVNETD
jgi:hypothetical protein